MKQEELELSLIEIAKSLNSDYEEPYLPYDMHKNGWTMEEDTAPHSVIVSNFIEGTILRLTAQDANTTYGMYDDRRVPDGNTLKPLAFLHGISNEEITLVERFVFAHAHYDLYGVITLGSFINRTMWLKLYEKLENYYLSTIQTITIVNAEPQKMMEYIESTITEAFLSKLQSRKSSSGWEQRYKHKREGHWRHFKNKKWKGHDKNGKVIRGKTWIETYTVCKNK